MLGLVVPCAFAATSNEAQDAINRAESRMNLVHDSVLEAETSGANISGLLQKLNNASMLLSKAKTYYRIKNFSEAMDSANQCFDSLNGVEVEADNLRATAAMAKKNSFFVSSLVSVFAIGAVYYACFFAWRFFKDKYRKRILTMKPEVQVNDPG
jgi:exonuclease VII small subunit